MLTACKMSYEKAELYADQKVRLKAINIQYPHGTQEAQVTDLKGLCKAKFLDRVSLLPFQLPDIVRDSVFEILQGALLNQIHLQST